MSSKTRLNQLKKEDLVNTVLNLEKQVREIGKSGSDEKLSEQLDTLLKENKRLQGELESAKKSESFVAIELLSQGKVWLPSPESRSGRPEDANKGYLLRKTGEIALIPSYWMIDYIANRNPAFIMGDVRINNEKGKRLSPGADFTELDIPKEFLEGAVPPEDILANVRKGGDDLHIFIKKYEDKPFVLAKIMSVVDGVMADLDDKDPKKQSLTSLSEHIDRLINPDTTEDNK